MMVLWLWLSKREWRGGFIVGLSIGVLVAWRAFITWRLFPIYGTTTFLFTPGNIGMPFKGFIDLWAVIGRGEYFLDFPPLAVAGRLFPIVLTAALMVSLVLLWKRRDGLSAAAVAASLIAVSLDYPNVLLHVGNAERVSFDVFVLLLAIFGTIVPDRRVSDGAGARCRCGQRIWNAELAWTARDAAGRSSRRPPSTRSTIRSTRRWCVTSSSRRPPRSSNEPPPGSELNSRSD